MIASRRPSIISACAALVALTGLAVVYTWPLAVHLGSAIASDPGDPSLNATVLWWNATVTPLTSAWWNPPYFHPASGVTAFTENLLGLSVFASPVFWVTHNPVTAYNASLLATFVISGLTVYLLVARLTADRLAGFIAGLAFAFSPYRTAELPHIQSLAMCWLPLALLGLHAYLDDRRPRWLLVFGVCWILQSLADGYYMFFGAVLVACWIAYFCSRTAKWGTLGPVCAAWIVSSVPLVPILRTYQRVHDDYGLHRSRMEALTFSAKAADWFHVKELVAAWHPLLADKDQDLFPGVVAAALVVAGLSLSIYRTGAARMEESRPHRAGRRLAALVAAASAVAIVTAITVGPWDATVGGVHVRMTTVGRGLVIFVVAAGVWLKLSKAGDGLSRRSPLFFYAAVMLLMAALCLGPVVQTPHGVVMDPAPYGVLMKLPGFLELRAPARFWMIGVMCLSAAAGIAFSRLPIERGTGKLFTFTAVAIAILADGWVFAFPIAPPPVVWAQAEPSARSRPILELPIGHDWDAAATFRSLGHRRPVFNGVSGYEPPHYAPLLAGIESRDPEILAALASLGPYDIVVSTADDRDGSLERYASSAAGAVRVKADAAHTVFEVPPAPFGDQPVGNHLSIASVRASERNAPALVDGRLENEWVVGPQLPDEWVEADLGSIQPVASVVQHLGVYARDFPRLLAIELSSDGVQWNEVWRGPTAARALLAAIRAPIDAPLTTAFTPQMARYVRLRQLATHKNLWRIAELEIRGPR